jgi:voltage-gated potassium channel
MMDPAPSKAPPAHPLDGHFWRSLGFSFALAGLVSTAATGSLSGLNIAMLGSTLVGFAAFYFAFPRGLHIAVAQTTMQAVYMCAFVFFRDSNFARAAQWQAWIGFILPVAGFLCGALVQRGRIRRLIATESVRHVRFNHLLRWAAPVGFVGALSFLLPDVDPDATMEGIAFLAAMAAIALIVGLAARDVVVFIIDTSLVFEAFFERVTHLAIPAFAFLTFWTLLAIGFACLYRIADLTTSEPQFSIAGTARRLEFAEALYFSVVTLATVGYGDISPVAPLVRLMAVAQMVAGLLLLLFGVNELIRHAETVPQHRKSDHGHH